MRSSNRVYEKEGGNVDGGHHKPRPSADDNNIQAAEVFVVVSSSS